MGRVNIANVERQNYEGFAGTYRFKVTGYENKVTQQGKNPGSDMVTLELTVQEGPFQGRKVWDNFVFVEATAWRFAQFADATGLDADEFDSDTFGEMAMGCPEFVAKTRVKPETEEYDERTEIRKYIALDDEKGQVAGGSSLLS